MSLFQSISGFISSAIVGGSGSGGAGGGGSSGDPSLSSAASTPLSDGVSVFYQPPMARSRNPSGASSAQHSPVTMVSPPSLDLSHLSEEERRQIEAVLARAREVQDGPGQGLSTSAGLGGFGPGPGVGGAQFHRSRELHDEGHVPLFAPVPVLSAAPPPSQRPEPSPEPEVPLHTCAVCAETRMTESDRKICVDCRRNICLNCGSSDQTMEWLCNICHKRREIVTATTRWKASQQTSNNTDQSSSFVFPSSTTSSSTSYSSPSSIFSSPSVTSKQDINDRRREPPAIPQGPRPYVMQSALSRQFSDPPQRISQPSPAASSAANQATKQAISFRRQTSLPYATHADPKVNQPPASPGTPPSPPPPPPPPPPPLPPSIPPSFHKQSAMERNKRADTADSVIRSERHSSANTEYSISSAASEDLNHFEAALQRSKVDLTQYDLAQAEAEVMAGIYFGTEVEEMSREPEEIAEEPEVGYRRSRPHQLELSTGVGKQEEEGRTEEGGGSHGGGGGGGSHEDDDAFASTQMTKMRTSGERHPSLDDSPLQEPLHHQKQLQPLQRESISSSSSSYSSSSSSTSSASSSPPVSKAMEPAASNVSNVRTKGAKTTSSRSGAEPAAAESGSKKKPSALERVSLAGHHDFDRNQSPSRRSPKSPPRSPSWMRYRDSPPRSPPFRTLSPSISPTERFPSSIGDSQRVDEPQGAYVEEYEISLDGSDTAFVFDTLGPAEGGGDVEPRSSLYHVPQKPTRLLMEPLGCAGLLQPSAAAVESTSPLGRETLASFAASIASDTALLTSLSVSPMVEVQRNTAFGFGGGGSESFESDRQRIVGQGVALVAELTDPTPKTIDFQNAKRQKIKPPTASTDWSPVSDLSPILDVSPSVERIEQEMMATTVDEDQLQQQQQFRCNEAESGGGEWHDGAADAGGRRALPTAPLILSQQQQQSMEDASGRQSSLKRAPRFEDIRSVVGKGAEHDEVQGVDRGQSEVKRGQAEVNRGQGEVNRGQGEVNRGQGETSWDESEVNRGQISVNRGQIEVNRGQTGQSAVKRGHSEDNKGQSEVNRSQSAINRGQSRVSEEAVLQSRGPMNKDHVEGSQEQASFSIEQARKNREQGTREHSGMTNQQAGITRVQAGMTQQHTGMTQQHTGMTKSQAGMTQQHTGMTKPQTGMTQQHTGMTQQHTGMTQQHTGMTQPQTGMTQQHTGMTKPQTGMTQQHTGMTQQHTGMTQQHTGMTQPQTGMTQQHAGMTKPQTGMTQQHTGVTQQHTGMTQQHAGMTKPQTGMTQQHTEMTKPQTGMTQQHTGMTQQHTGMTIPQTGMTQQPTGMTQQHTGIAQQHAGMAQQHTGMARPQTGMTQQPTGMTQQHTGMAQQHTGMTIPQTGMTQQPTGMTQQHTGIAQQQTGIAQQHTGMAQQHTGMTKPQMGMTREQQGMTQPPTGVIKPQTGMTIEHAEITKPQMGMTKEQTEVTKEQTGIVRERTGSVREQIARINRGEIGANNEQHWTGKPEPEMTVTQGMIQPVARTTRDSTAKHQVGDIVLGSLDRDDGIRGHGSLNRERFSLEMNTTESVDAHRATFEQQMTTQPTTEVVFKDPGLRNRPLPVHKVQSGRTTSTQSRTPDGASDPNSASFDAHVRTATAQRPEVEQSRLRSGTADALVAVAEKGSDVTRVRRHLPAATPPAATAKTKPEVLHQIATRNQTTSAAPSSSSTTTTSSFSSPFQTSPVVASGNGDSAANRKSAFETELVVNRDRKLTYDSEGSSVQRITSMTTRSPGSPVDSNRKPRRRLPSLPPEAEIDWSPQQLRRVRSRSADSRSEERNPEKERLRRCLRMREIEQRKSFDRDDGISITAGQQQQPQHRSRTGSWNGEDLRPRTTGRKSRVDSMPPGSRRGQTGTAGGGGGGGSGFQRSWLSGSYADPSLGGTSGDVKNSYAERSNDPIRGRMYTAGGNGGARSETKVKPKWNSKSKPVEMVTIRGVQVPADVKSLKQRIREELQIVTASRRLRLDEEEEVRRMESEMAIREKQRRLKAEKEAVEESAKKEADKKKKKEQMDKEQQRLHPTIDSDKPKLGSGRVTTSTASPGVAVTHHSTLPRISPQASPRRARHRRQNSDPMIAKFSPIEEDRDIETELHYQRQQLSSEARRLAASLANYTSPLPVRRNRKYTAGLSHPTAFEETLKRYYNTPVYGSLSRSSDLLAKLSLLDKEARMSSSQSESCLPITSRSKTPTYYSDDDDVKNKEEKKLLLQMEIGLRKRQLEETKMLQKEIQRLVEMPDISPFEMEKARLLYQQHLRARDNLSSSSSAGIIRPIDHQGKMTDTVAAAQRRQARESSRIPVSASSTLRHPVRQSSSSDSSDYITHRPTTSDVLLTKTNVSDNTRQTDIPSHVVRSTSEHSLADSDEYIMEGGVTIRRRKKAKTQPKSQTESQPLRQYDFPTKRILLTRDPKDKSLQGNGIGVKIVGGKIMSDRDGELGAFVTAIFRGGVADQLHGELHEGDQVIEWNGITLTGKTFEEVQQIMSQPNGEIELVIRTTESSISSKPSSSVSTIQTDSRRSSYDNLEAQSDYDDYGHSKVRRSPGVSPGSSQHDLQTGSSMSTSGSSDPTDILSATREPEHPASNAVGDKSTKKQGKDLGEIQLQLSYDTYDGTLNVHVIQARRLQPKDTNGFSDPYVKLYLLPSRSSENKRRTRYISKTLDPEWHQTFVFMGIPRNEMPLKTLEVSVWDYDRFKPNDFLGQVVLNLSETSYLDNRPHWYPLQKLNAAQPLVARGRFDSFSHPGSDQPGGNGGTGPGGSSRVSPSGRGATTGAEGHRSNSTTGGGGGGGGGGAGPGSLPRRRSSSPRERNRNSGNSPRTMKADRSGYGVGTGGEGLERNRRAVPSHNHGSRVDGGGGGGGRGGGELPRQFSNGSTLSTKTDLSDRFSPIQIRQHKMATHHEAVEVASTSKEFSRKGTDRSSLNSSGRLP